MSKRELTKNLFDGTTTDGCLVLGGAAVFKMYETYGTPVFVIANQCHEHGWQIGWAKFIGLAHGASWSKERIRNTIEEAEDGRYDKSNVMKSVDCFLDLLVFKKPKQQEIIVKGM